MQYIKEGFTLPVPLNLVPTPSGVYHAVKCMIERLRHGDRRLEHVNSISMHSTEDLPSNLELKSQVSASLHPNNANASLRYATKSEQPNGRRREAIVQHHQSNAQHQANTEEGQKMTYRVSFF
jgi:hypothetical protein